MSLLPKSTCTLLSLVSTIIVQLFKFDSAQSKTPEKGTIARSFGVRKLKLYPMYGSYNTFKLKRIITCAMRGVE